MPKITTFVYCENIGQEMTPSGPKMHIIGPLQVISLNFLPTNYSFTVVFGIIGIVPNDVHNLQIIFCDEKGNIMSGSTTPIKIPINENFATDSQGFFANWMVQNVQFDHVGIYYTKIILDKMDIGIYPIKVDQKGNKHE